MGQEQLVIAGPPPCDCQGEQSDREEDPVYGHRNPRERTCVNAVLDLSAAFENTGRRANDSAPGQLRIRQVRGDPESDHVQRREDSVNSVYDKNEAIPSPITSSVARTSAGWILLIRLHRERLG